MSSDSSIYSYDKYSILTGIILGVIIFALFFAGSYSIYKFYTLNIVFKKAKYYIDLLSNPDKRDKEKNQVISEKDDNGFAYVLRMVDNLNYALFGNFFDAIFKKKKQPSKPITPSSIYNEYIDKLTLRWAPKLYMILLASGTILMLLKLTVNFTFTTIIAKTIDSDNDVTPYGQTTFKPSTSYFSEFAQMVLLFLLNVLIAISPTVFIYMFNLIKWFYTHIKGIWLMILTLIIFICVLVYFYYNLFSGGFDLTDDPTINSATSNESYSKSILKSFFNTQDSDFADSIFSFKNTFAGSFGIWIFVYIVFFIFEYKYINNIEVRLRDRMLKFLTIGLVLFAYCLYLSYRNYGKNDGENDVFDSDYKLRDSMYKDSVNNIFQAIVKYNYPCMPFTSS